MESEIFTSFLNYDFAFVNYGHVAESAHHTEPNLDARDLRVSKEKVNGEKKFAKFRASVASEMEQCAKSLGIGFSRGMQSEQTGVLHKRTRSAAALTKANSVARTGFRGSANDFLIKHVLCAVTRPDGGSSQCRSPSPCINIHLNFKTLSAINTAAALPLLSRLSLPL